MAGTKKELRSREKELKKKILKYPNSNWEKELEYVKKQLYGDDSDWS